MKNGFQAFDSDMHVYDAVLYEKYMNPKWGDRIPMGREMVSMDAWNFSSAVAALRWSQIMTPCPRCRSGYARIGRYCALSHVAAHFPCALDEFLEIEEVSDMFRRKILWDDARGFTIWSERTWCGYSCLPS